MIAAAKPLTFTRATLARPSVATISKARKAMVVRAAEEAKPEASTGEAANSTVFYGGNTFASEEEVSICGSHALVNLSLILQP